MKRQARFMSSVGGLVHLAHAPPIMTIADSDEEWAGALDQALDEEADDVVHVPFTCWNDQCARLDANLIFIGKSFDSHKLCIQNQAKGKCKSIRAAPKHVF